MGYMTTLPNEAAPASQAAPTKPCTTGSSYGFIVSQPNYAYTVTVTVQYQGGGQNSATLTFTKSAPTGSLAVQKVGTQTTQSVNGVLSVGLDPGIQMSAAAGVGSTPCGIFMLMQIVTKDQGAITDANGVGWFRTNTGDYQDGDFDGNLLDGFAYEYKFQNQYASYWTLSVSSGNTEMPSGGWDDPYMTATPSTESDAGDASLSLSVGFSTYLMYQPFVIGSVWIALSEIDWSFSGDATQGQQQQQSAQPQPNGPSTPAGAACFPTWVNLESSFLAAGWQEDQTL
jgi:hypothetical protein